MEAKHTNGPWHTKENLDGVQLRVMDESGDIVVCQCFHANKTFEREANARLISAAPEMLEALEALLAEWESKERVDGREWGQREVVMARAAIAKAKGQA